MTVLTLTTTSVQETELEKSEDYRSIKEQVNTFKLDPYMIEETAFTLEEITRARLRHPSSRK